MFAEDSSVIPVNVKKIEDEVRSAAGSSGISIQDLRPRVLLQLARYKEKEINGSIVTLEVKQNAEKLFQVLNQNYFPLKYDLQTTRLSDYVIDMATPQEVDLLIGRLHYLRSVRHDAINLCLRHRSLQIAVSIISLSPFDLYHVNVEPYSNSSCLVLSRMYSLAHLPSNFNSYFIGRMVHWIKTSHPNFRLILTYLNRNVGFTGTIYRSTNWTLIARETGTRYTYLNGDYISDRTLKNQFSEVEIKCLLESNKVEFSEIYLEPLEIYGLPILSNDPIPKCSDVRNPNLT